MPSSPDIESRVRKFEAYAKADPQNALIWLNLGDLYHQQSRFDAARECFEKCLTLAPSTNAARSRLASVLISQHRFTEAESALRELLINGDDDSAVHFNLGLALYYQERWAEAETYFSTAYERDVPATECCGYLARCRHYAGDTKRAIEWCQRWVDARRDAESQGYLALLHMDHGDMARARELADEVLARAPDNPHAELVAGTAAVEQQDVEVAARYFERLVAREPNDARAWLGMGLVHLYRQQHVEAIRALERSIELLPDNSGAIVTLGWAHLANRDAIQAERVFRRALDVNHNFAEAHGGLASTLALQRRIDEAQKEIRTATRLDARNFGGAFAQSILLKIHGRPEAATELLTRVLEQAPRPDGSTLLEQLDVFLRNAPPQIRERLTGKSD